MWLCLKTSCQKIHQTPIIDHHVPTKKGTFIELRGYTRCSAITQPCHHPRYSRHSLTGDFEVCLHGAAGRRARNGETPLRTPKRNPKLPMDKICCYGARHVHLSRFLMIFAYVRCLHLCVCVSVCVCLLVYMIQCLNLTSSCIFVNAQIWIHRIRICTDQSCCIYFETIQLKEP
jgi:hypothetical protein